MNIIARRTGGDLLEDLGDGKGRVWRDLRSWGGPGWKPGTPLPLISILARGYWEPAPLTKAGPPDEPRVPAGQTGGGEWVGNATPAQIATAARLAPGIRDLVRERNYVIAPDGKIIDTRDEDPTSNPDPNAGHQTIMTSSDAYRYSKMGGVLFLHNHPREASFSLGDVEGAARSNGSAWIVARTADGREVDYRIGPPHGGWPGFGKIQQAYEDAHSLVYDSLAAQIDQGQMTLATADPLWAHRTWAMLDAQGLVNYRREYR